VSLFSKLFKKADFKSATLSPGDLRFTVGKGETILESALREGIAFPHDCTVGACGSCRSKLINGQVEAITPFGYTLSKDELDAGYILACQALPKTDVILEVAINANETESAITCQARIARVEPLTHDISRVTWALDQPMRYRAGQYVNVQVNDGKHRSYSFAAAPSTAGLSEITTFIRHVPGGLFTDMLFTGAAAALDFELNGPHGNFWLREGEGPIICIAGGSGLAPLISLLSSAAQRRVRRDCILLYGGRGARDLYAEAEIAAIRTAWTAGFDFWPVLSEESAPGMRHGFFTSFIPEALQKLGAGAQAYLCGPPAMIDAGIDVLRANGVAIEDVHYDKFTDASTQPTK